MLRSLLQHHSSKASILWCSTFFMVQLSGPYVTSGKNTVLTRWTFVSRVMSLLSNTLSRFCLSVSSVQSLSHVQLFVMPWIAALQVSLSFTISQGLLKLMSIESVMPSNHLILCHTLSSCLQYLPVSGSFPVSQFFTSGDQSIGVSALTLVLPMNIQTDLL